LNDGGHRDDIPPRICDKYNGGAPSTVTAAQMDAK